MQRSTLPLLLLVLLVGAVFMYFRPIQVGDLAALAQDLDLPAWPATRTPAGPNEYPDTGYPPPAPRRATAPSYGSLRDNSPVRPGRIENPPYGDRIENPPYDAWSDPFGDRSPGVRPGPRAQRDPPVSVPPARDGGSDVTPAGATSEIPCLGAEILARVGSDVILARDVSMGIDDLREKNKDRTPESVLEQGIREIQRKRVEQQVEIKLVCLHARRKIPKDKYGKVVEQFDRYYEQHQVPDMMKRMNLASRRDLELALRKSGTSLEIDKRAFIEGVLAQEWLRSEVKPDEDVSYDELQRYYRQHAAEFVVRPPMARWEQLMVRPARFPSRAAAYAALAEMGNEVLDGAPLAEVAKAGSHGPTAAQGGLWERTSKGGLVSTVLDNAVFTLPVGRLSDILEDEQGFHVVRVIERQAAVMKPFADAQEDIRKKIRSWREDDARAAFIARLRDQTPVWTAFDKDRSLDSARIDSLFQ